MPTIGFLINPIAGMGGRVGLKGTDDVVDEAIRRGAEPIAQKRSVEALRKARHLLQNDPTPSKVSWLTCSGEMGAGALSIAGFSDAHVIYQAPEHPTCEDTGKAVRRMIDAGANLILFCGGDGTARDICKVIGTDTPILGIPSGVKMYSGVFGITPEGTAQILIGFLTGILGLAEVDVLDLDEERFRKGEWAVKLYYAACTPYEPSRTQAAKAQIDEASDAGMKVEIADHLCEAIATHPEVLFILGAGSTVKSIADRLGVAKSLLGVDAVAGGAVVGTDLNERQLKGLLKRYSDRRLVLSPIGAQGFVLGRGNLQLSPEVIKEIGPDNILVVATPAKLARTPVLLFDTGSRDLDRALTGNGYLPVVTGYRRRRLVKTLPDSD